MKSVFCLFLPPSLLTSSTCLWKHDLCLLPCLPFSIFIIITSHHNAWKWGDFSRMEMDEEKDKNNIKMIYHSRPTTNLIVFDRMMALKLTIKYIIYFEMTFF